MKALPALLAIFIISCTPLFSQSVPNQPNFLKQAPLEFIENRGQFVDSSGKPAKDILYVTDIQGRKMYVRKSGISYVISKFENRNPKFEKQPPAPFANGKLSNNDFRTIVRIDMDILNMNPNAIIRPEEKMECYNNYYFPHCPNGITHVPVYKKVVYENAYDNIDLVLYDNKGDAEYDFVVKPGADPSEIKLDIKAADKVSVDSDGNLVIESALGKIQHIKPYSYQLVNGQNKEVTSSFKLSPDGKVSIDVRNYDRNKKLVIDPLIRVWGTYYGGESYDWVSGLAVDDSGYVYASGWAGSHTGIATPGTHKTVGGDCDAFIARLDPDGKRIWGTYYGGSMADYATGICLDKMNNIIICGNTFSLDGIATPGAHKTENIDSSEDAFIARFDKNGLLIWGTYYGNTNYPPGNDLPYKIACDSSNNIYICGTTTSQDGIATLGSFRENNDSYREIVDIQQYKRGYDGFLAKFSSSGKILWGTYFGGKYDDAILSLALDKNSDIVVAGFTASKDNIATPGSYQQGYGSGFLAKFKNDGKLLWSTYAVVEDSIRSLAVCDIAIDTNNNIAICGYVGKNINISTPGAYQPDFGGGGCDHFVGKYSSDGKKMWVTYLGGGQDEEAFDPFGAITRTTSLVVDEDNLIYVTGTTRSNDKIATANAFKKEFSGLENVYFCVYDSGGTKKYGTYYGYYGDLSYAIYAKKRCVYIGGYTMSGKGIATEGTYESEIPNNSGSGYIAKFVYLPEIFIDTYDSTLTSKPDTVNLGNVCLDKSLTCDLIVKNESQRKITLKEVAVTDNVNFSAKLIGRTILNWQDTSKARLVFHPQKQGVLKTYFLVYIDDAIVPVDTVLVIAKAVGSDLQISGTTDFSIVKAGQTKTLTLQVTNKGNAAAYIETLPLLPKPFSITDVKPPLPVYLLPDSSMEIIVEFSPENEGDYTCLLNIFSKEDSLSCSDSTGVTLKGRSADFQVEVNPNSVDFGLTADCQTMIDTVTLVNKAKTPLTLATPAVIQGKNRNEFKILIQPAVPYEIKPSDTAIYVVEFTPNEGYEEPKSATLVIYTDKEGFKEIKVDIKAETEVPEIAYDPTEIDLGTATMNQAVAGQLKIKNNKKLDIHIKDIISNNSDISFIPSSCIVKGSEEKSIDIAWLPSKPGSMAAIIKVVIDEPCPDTIIINAKGNAVEGKLAFNSTVNYGIIASCEEAIDSISIENVGNADVEIMDLTIEDANGLFTFTDTISLPLILKENEKLVRLVKFSGISTSDGIKTALVKINAKVNGKDEEYSIALVAERTSINLEPNPINITVSGIAGQTSRDTIKLRNNSKLAITIENITVINNPGIFTVTPDNNIDLQPQEEKDVYIDYKPLESKVYEDELLIKARMNDCRNEIKGIVRSNLEATVLLPYTSAYVGNQDFAIPLTIKLNKDTTIKDLSYTAKIRFNATCYEPVTAINAIFLNNKIVSGERVVALQGTRTVSKTDTILGEMRGNIYLGLNDRTDLILDDIKLSDSLIKVTKLNGELRVKGLCQQNLSKVKMMNALMLSVVPSPASDESELILAGDAKGTMSVVIYSIEGIKKGTIEINKTGFEAKQKLNLKDYSSGVYQLVLQSGGECLNVPMVVVK